MRGRLSIAITAACLLGCSGESAPPPAADTPPVTTPPVTTPPVTTPPPPAPVPATPPQDVVDVEGKKLLAIGQQIVDASRSGDCVTFMAAVQGLSTGAQSPVSAALAAKVMEKYGPELQRLIESTGPTIAKCRYDPAWIAAMKQNADTWGRRMVGIAERIARAAAAPGGDCAAFAAAVEPLVPELTVLRGQPPTGDEVKPQLDAYAASFGEALAPARALLTRCAADATVAALVPLLERASVAR